MYKLYDDNHQFVMILDKNLYNVQEHEIFDTGLKSLTFEVQCGEPYISVLRPEYYIEAVDYSYVIKYVEYNENNTMEITCKANIEDFEHCGVPIFDAFALTEKQYLDYCCSLTSSWTVDDYRDRITASGKFVKPDTNKKTVQKVNVNLWDMIKYGIKIYKLSGSLWFDTKNKVIIVRAYSAGGQNDEKAYKIIPKVYVSNDIKTSSGVVNTLDFATVIYPIGKNGLTIEFVNPTGEKFLENYSYTNKKIVKYIQTNHTQIDDLYQAGLSLIKEYAYPKTSYEVVLQEIDENIQVGNLITVIDSVKGLRIQERIVAIHRFPYEPEQTTIEIGERAPDLSQLLVEKEEITGEELDEIRDNLSALTKT